MDTVTREKHPGRVAQGHKLAALMKQRKEELKQNKKSEQETAQSSELTQEPQVNSSHKALYASGGAVIIVVGAVAWYFFLRKDVKDPKPKGPPLPKKDDIFSMR